MQPIVDEYLIKKGLSTEIALSFSDVVIKDNFSEINSRSDIQNLNSKLALGVVLKIPIVSANMDTVTDARMAIALARLGGLGFIHQFFPLTERLDQVRIVKRADNAIIDEPITITLGATLKEAKEVMTHYGVSSVLVIDEKRKLLGILASRDYRFKTDDSVAVAEIMRGMPLTTGTRNMSSEKVAEIFSSTRVEKLPLVDSEGILEGLITAKDLLKKRENPNAVYDVKGRLLTGVGIRLNGDYLDEVEQLIKAGADVILLDTARANSKRVQEAVQSIKKQFPEVPLVVGNIDTPEAAEMLITAGADCLKVGIGPGSACKTRQATGVGIPQLTAVASCVAVAHERGVPIIADGGIREGSDLSKALVAGADLVMIGGLLGGSDEAPGEVFHDDGKRWKMYRGSASAEHQIDRIETGSLSGIRTPEGVPRRIPCTGPAKGLIEELLGGLRSSMSYVGAHDLDEFRAKGMFVRQTNSGWIEGKPRE